MSIRQWPLADRPREKLLQLGPQALTEAELLALFLQSGTQGRSALDVARDLLVQFRSLRGLLTADCAQVCQVAGMGPARFALLQAALELARRHYQERIQAGPVLSHSQATRDFLRMRLRDLPHEVFCCLYLDNHHQVLGFEILFRGTLDSTSVHPREVIKRVLAHNAAALILAHNHPSGVAEPSQADRILTQHLKSALALIEVRILDHLIVGDECVSLADRGWL